MHILYIHQYFTTPLGCGGTRSYEFAKRWAAKGHKVTMLTSIAKLTDADLSAAKGWIIKRFKIDKIDVLALSVPYRQQMGALKRCLAFLGFLSLASLVVLFIKKVDIVYATSTPLTVGVPALVARWFRRKKYIFEVRDQWPTSVEEVGVIKNKFIIKILSWLERFIYKNSAAIVAVSESMAEDIRKITGNEKPIYAIPNGADLDLFRPDIDGSKIRRDRAWGDKLVLLHAGAMAKITGLEFVIYVAEKLRDHQDILFVLIGEGSKKEILKNHLRRLGLTNVQILDSVPRNQLPNILAASDVIVAIIGKFPIIERHASLNKFYDGLSAGRPLLLNYSGWQRKLIEENHAGLGCKLCDVDEFAEKVLYLKSHSDELNEMGQNARRISEEKFDRDKLAQQTLDLITAVRAAT